MSVYVVKTNGRSLWLAGLTVTWYGMEKEREQYARKPTVLNERYLVATIAHRLASRREGRNESRGRSRIACL